MPVTICYEGGINHQGDLDLAKQMIDIAAETGCTVIKWQKRTIERCYTAAELAQVRPGPWGATNGELKRRLEFGAAEYATLDEHCRKRGIAWTASAWDEEALAFLLDYDLPYLKIPSALLTHAAMLAAYADTGLPLVLSTGMSTREEIDEAVRRVADVEDVTLAHTTSTYPCRLEELNLLAIADLQVRYPDRRIGFSSHAVSPWPCLAAVALGASYIEFHGTRDRTLWGSDQSASLEPEAVRKLVREIRDLETALGTGEKIVYDSELPAKAKLRK